MSDMYEKILMLCEENGIKPGRLCADTGLSRGLMTDLKMGRTQTLSAKNVKKVADYFNVTTDYLLGFTVQSQIDSTQRKIEQLKREVDVASGAARERLLDELDLLKESYSDLCLAQELAMSAEKKTPTPEGEFHIINKDIRMIARAGLKMTPEQAENVRKYAQYMFPEAFEE